ncbi:MAG: hypothetical protein BWZ09_02744 [Alphaproteobacteria bacterium ADurb.BinA305]|nr:MAG: hypothetical protein BWZ09_02744 [Alphaproteobacteria bacterium ADurb.BinA305]
MRAIIKRAGFLPEEVILSERDTLKATQAAVGGHIEMAFCLPSHEEGYTVDVYCNEEGRLRGLPLNILNPRTGDVIVGDVIAVRGDPEGNTVDLTDLEVRAMLRVLTAASPLDDLLEGN